MSPERLQYLIDGNGGWPFDSITWPIFIMDLERELGRTIDESELHGIQTVEELRQCLELNQN